MTLMVVVLFLTTWDADTGEKLYESNRRIITIQQDKIDECRKIGVRIGETISAYYRANGHGNAFTNVDCQWERAFDPA